MLVAIKRALYTNNAFVLKTSRFRLLGLLKFLRNHLLYQYRSLVDIVVYDNTATPYRFAVVYNLLSNFFNSRLLVCIYTTGVLEVPSVCSLYVAANWLEREA
jgi:NADH-quinone oxidoreductase subunit C